MKALDMSNSIEFSQAFQPGQFLKLVRGEKDFHHFNPRKNIIYWRTYKLLNTLFGGELSVPFKSCYSALVKEEDIITKSRVGLNAYILNGEGATTCSKVWNSRKYLWTIVKVRFSCWDDFFSSIRSCKVAALDNYHLS
ncbi:hypothetical protein CJU89_3607 [Yarrowia sp. B02]|nr:hypothetical protein CJU89_3607 [Yarrowia sp. B02]